MQHRPWLTCLLHARGPSGGFEDVPDEVEEHYGHARDRAGGNTNEASQQPLSDEDELLDVDNEDEGGVEDTAPAQEPPRVHRRRSAADRRESEKHSRHGKRVSRLFMTS